MSGTKPVDLEAQVRLREERLRKEAEERARRELAAAKERLAAYCETLRSEVTQYEQRGFSALGNLLSREIATAGAPFSADINLHGVGLRQAKLEEARQRLASCAALIAKIPDGAAREALLQALARCSSIEEADGQVCALLLRLPALRVVEEQLAEISRTLHLLRACEVAGVHLDREHLQARADLEAFLRQPDVTKVADAGLRAIAARSLRLETELRQHETALHACLTQLQTEPWPSRLQAWRPDFARDLQSLDAWVARGDWRRGASLIAEIDAFLHAHARLRVELLCEGASDAGLRPAEIEFDGVHGAYRANIFDDVGLFAIISEIVADWRRGPLHQSPVIAGPSDWDVEQCRVGGVDRVIDSTRRRGHTVSLVAAPAQVSPMATGTAAAPQKTVRQKIRQ